MTELTTKQYPVLEGDMILSVSETSSLLIQFI